MFKQLHYFKSWLLLMLCMIVGVGSASAEDVTETIVLSEQGYDNAQQVSSTSGTVVTLTYTDGGTATAYYNTGTGVRVYAGGKMTITADGKTITNVSITHSQEKTPTVSFSSNGTTTASSTGTPATWEGSATSVDFNVATKGHVRIQSVAVTYSASGSGSSKLNPDISFTQTSYEINLGDAFTAPTLNNPNNLNVTYTSDNADVAYPEKNSGAITLGNMAGTATITATFNGNTNYEAGTASYTLTVLDPSAAWIKVSPEDLKTGDVVVIVDLNTSKAMNNTGGTGSAPTATAVTLNNDKSAITSAIISDEIKWKVTFSDGSYQFGKPGTDTYLYCTDTNNGVRVGTNANNKFEIITHTNTKVYLHNIATGRYLGVYSGQSGQDWRCYTSVNSNIEATNTAFYRLASTTSKEDPGLAYATTSYEINIGESFTAPELTNPNNLTVTYSSTNTEVAAVASDGAVTLGTVAGTTTITAYFAGDENYYEGSASYTLTIVDPNAPGTENNPYTVTAALAAEAVGEVFVQGTISAIEEVNTQYHNATYTITDGTSSMTVFRGRYLDNADFTSTDQIGIGDVVKVYGKLTVYNHVNQMGLGNYIVSWTRKPAPTIKLVDEDETEVEDELNVQFDGQKGLDVYCFANDVDITNDVEITWTSADETIATYDGAFVNGLAMGTTTITFNFAGNADYRPVSKVLTVNVEDARTPVTLTFGEVPSSINVGETASYPIEEGYSVTYTSSDDNIVSVDEDGEITANAVGTATITATYDGDEMFQPATASYTITVVDPSAPVHESYYKKVTSTADITDGEYLIVYPGDNTHASVAFNGALTTLDAVANTIAVTINNDKIAATSQIDAATFTIDVKAGTLMSASGKYIGVSANSNGLKISEVAETYKHIFTIDDAKNAVIKADFEESIMTLRYNSASNQSRFRYYAHDQQDIQLFKKVEEDCIPVTITSAGAASFSSKYALDFSKVSELTAYKATSKSDSYVHLDEVEQVPAGAGVIVKGAEGLYSVPVVTGDVAELEGNLLVGTAEAEYTVGDDYGKVFKYVKTNAGVVGFQKAKVDWTCQAGHAYLMLSETSAREFIGIFDEDISTGINSIDNGQWTIDNDAPAYNLAGQKVGKGYKGIVVKNGKKYVK